MFEQSSHYEVHSNITVTVEHWQEGQIRFPAFEPTKFSNSELHFCFPGRLLLQTTAVEQAAKIIKSEQKIIRR